MENLTVITIAIIVSLLVLLAFLFKRIKEQKRVIIFLDGVDKGDKLVKSTHFLASLGIKNLKKYGYKLEPFYHNVFCLSTIMHIPEMVDKISQYIKRLNRLEDFEEKEYLLDVFKQTLLDCETESLAFIIYYAVKIKHRDDNDNGKRVEDFLFYGNSSISLRSINLIIDKINFYEKCEPVLGDTCRIKIRENLDEIIKNIKK